MLPPIVNNSTDAISHMKKYGLALIDGQLSATQLEQARQAIYDSAAEDKRLGNNVVTKFDSDDGNTRVWNALNRHPVFSELVQLPIVLELIKELLGRALLNNISANIAHPRNSDGVWHADQMLIPRPWASRPQGINFVFPLDEFTDTNGATKVIPGSHLWPGAPDMDKLESQGVPLVAPAGTVIAMEGRVWHRTGTNTSTSPRAGLFGWFMRPIYRTQENWFLSLDASVVDNASDTLLELLGYKVKGVLGRVNGASPM